MREAWRVGVTIAMATTGTDLIGEIGRALGMGSKLAQALTHDLGAVRTAALGAIGAFAGFKGLEAIKRLATDFDYNTEKTRFALSDPGHVQQAENLAIKTQGEVPTTTFAENMKVINELSGQVGSVEEVAKILPRVMKLAAIIHEQSGADMNASVVQATKFADLSGQIFTTGADGKEHVDAGKFATAMETVERMSIASRGLLGPADLLAFAKQAGVEIRNMTPQAIAAMGEAMIAMGASRAGTAETSLFSQFAGGRMTQTTAREMVRVGLLDEGDVTPGKGDQVLIKRAKLDSLANQASDPAKLAADVAAKLAADGQSKQQIMPALFRLFGRQTTQRLMAELIQGAPQMKRFGDNYATAGSTDQNYATLQSQGAAQNVEAFDAAWKSLMEALGEASAPVLIALMQPLSAAIRAIAAAAAAHPTVAATLLGLAAGIAAIAAALIAADHMPDFKGVDPSHPWIAAVDNWLSQHTNIGHSYKEQGQPDGPPAPAAPVAPRRSFVRGAPGQGQGPTGTADDPIHTSTTIANLRDTVRAVTAGQAREAHRPSAGTTGPDWRMTPDPALQGVY